MTHSSAGSVELLPCPFCTDTLVELESVEDGSGNLLYAYVCCDECNARGPQFTTVAGAMDGWNDRASLQPATPADPLYDSRNPNHGRVGGLYETPATPVEAAIPSNSAGSDSARKALADCLGCVEAAEAEGLHELIVELRGSNESVDRLIDLIDRRLLWVREYAAPVLSQPDAVAQAAPDLHAWRFIKDNGQWSPWIVLADAEAVAAFKDLMGHNLERGTHQLQSFFAVTSSLSSTQSEPGK